MTEQEHTNRNQTMEQELLEKLMVFDYSYGGYELKKGAAKVVIQALSELRQYRDTGLTPQMAKDLIQSEKAAHKAALENAHKVDEYQEAIKWVEARMRSGGSRDEVWKAGDLAIKALEKQIPKKPIMKPWSPALCPSCGCELSESLGDGYYKHYTHLKVCDCGQKLEWS